MRRKDISGQKFGRLVAIDYAETRENASGQKTAYWNCLCDCGKKCIKSGVILRQGCCKSCGCIEKERQQRTKDKINSGKKRQWTKEQEQILINNYSLGYDKLGEMVGKSRESVGGKIIRLRKEGKIIDYIRPEISGTKNGSNKTGSNSPLWKGCGALSASEFARIRNNAIIRNHKFELSIEDVWNLYIKQDKKCNYTGLELNWNIGSGNSSINEPGNASLDQIVSGKGYIKGNIQILHKDINKMKHDLTQEEFFEYVNLLCNPKTPIKSEDCKIQEHGGRFLGFGNIYKTCYESIRDKASKRNLSFNITIEGAWELFLKQDGCCALTGISLKMPNHKWGGTASLDRINSILGYVLDNVRWVHKNINNIKWEFDDKYLFYMCHLIKENKLSG